jgi:hypothetical protein
MTIAVAVIMIVKAYLLTGLAVAIPFLVFGIDRTDPSALGAYGFRPLIFPGLVLLWPLVALRWAGIWKEHPDGDLRAQRNAHLWIWAILALLLSAALTLAWSQRQVILPQPPSQRLSSTEGSVARFAQISPARSTTRGVERAS